MEVLKKMTQELREAQNNVIIEGILSENRLDYKKTGKGEDYISGDLLIEVTDENIVPVNFFSFKLKKDGTPNKIYIALDGVIQSYKSIAKHGREAADQVRITGGKLEGNEFYNAAGQLISTFRVRSNFVNRVTSNFSPQAAFAVEAFIQSIADEIVKDEPTDRLIVTGIVPMYGGRISLLTFFVETPEGRKYIKDNYSIGDTAKLAGKLNNEVIEINKTEEMEFGEDIINTFTRTKRELVITRGTKAYEENGFDKATIKQALVQREVDLQTALEQTMAKNAPSVGAEFNNEDVPF
jgi:hypothetical protein